jgi:hypothetical protein
MPFTEYLATAPADEFFWWSMIPAVLGVAACISSFVFLHRKRLIEDMPTSLLRSAAQGYIEVEGMARLMDGPPILCPLTGTRCAWWRYKVEEKRNTIDSRGRSKSEWVTVESGLSDDSFLLDDGTGRCVVDPVGATVIPTVTRRWYGRGLRPDVGWEAGRGFWRSMFCQYRYTEELLLPHKPVYALGAFRTQSGGPEAFDEQVDLTELLAKWKHDRKMMAMFDVNKDGTVDMKEWEAARRMALRKVRDEHVQRAVETPDLNILAKPRDRRPFILSGIPQEALVRRYTGYAMGSIGGTTLMVGFVLWALNLRGIIG